MSKSKETENTTSNPSTRWFEWVGSKGCLKYWDRDKKENFFVELPFRFIVLDQLNTVTGFSDALQQGFFANEVRDTRDKLTLRTKQGIHTEGIWKQDLSIIDGARFTKSIYIAYFDEDKELQLGNIKFSGSALGGLSDGAIDANLKAVKKDKSVELFNDAFLNNIGWFNFSGQYRKIENEDFAVELTGFILDKKGSNEFLRPVFKTVAVSEETNQKAIALDIELQIYLNTYFETKKVVDTTDGEEPTSEDYITKRNKLIAEEERAFAAPTNHVQPDIENDKIPFGLIFAFIGLAFYLAMFGQTIS